jgi:poly-gamma-glutamate synthesis protein (capsule biosynthesis protein)
VNQLNEKPDKKILKKTGILLIFTFLTLQSGGQNTGVNSQKISLLFLGDIMGHDEQIWAAEDRQNHTYNYDSIFKYIRPVISDSDVAIANFEVTLAGQPYRGYPQFSSPSALAAACKNAGIDCFVTANNHAADRGNNGITGTIYRLDSLRIQHTGTFTDQASRDSLQPLMIREKGFSIALLNYTYGTNGIKVSPPPVVNLLDKSLITSDIQKAKRNKPDMIILFIHWGTEYDTIPSASQVSLADYFFSQGVDLVIGSHPHVIQKMLWYKKDTVNKDRVVVFSLGNFVSNQRRPKTDGGSMARIEITRDGKSVYVSNTGYYLTWVYTPIEKYRKKFFVLPCSEFENRPQFFKNPSDFAQMKRFIDESRVLLHKQNINFSENIYSGHGWILN